MQMLFYNKTRWYGTLCQTPTSRAKKAWTLLVLSRQSKQLVLMVPPWVLKKIFHNVQGTNKIVILLYTSMYWFPTLRCPSLQSSRRTHTPLWTCWGRVWGHCGVCLPCLPLHFDGSQSSPFSPLLHALMPSGDSERDRQRKGTYCQKSNCKNNARWVAYTYKAAMFVFINVNPMTWILRKSLIIISVQQFMLLELKQERADKSSQSSNWNKKVFLWKFTKTKR